MTTIQPEGEAIRKAVQWASEERSDKADRPVKEIVEAACIRFNLSPKDAEFLHRFLQDGGTSD